MSTIANEGPEDIRFKKFMRTFDGYLIARVISREYDLLRGFQREAAAGKAAVKIGRARGLGKKGSRGIEGN